MLVYTSSDCSGQMEGFDGAVEGYFDVESRANPEGHRTVPFDERLTVCDVVDDCDIPHLLTALDRRGVSIDREISGT